MRISLSTAIIAAMLEGCAFGPVALQHNQVDYSRALADARKSEILSMIVGLRYADAPAALTLTQIIAAYTVDVSGSAVLNSIPDPSGPRTGATGAVTYSNHPTFTFTPTTGAGYAKAYIQPLSPGLILPLANGGVPIDLLLRITVQSIGPLNNATMLGGPAGNGSPDFYLLLRVLRRLQLAGKVAVRSVTGSSFERITLAFTDTGQVDADQTQARQLLGLPENRRDFELVTGSAAPGGELRIVTRSVLAILTDLGAEISVPDVDVRSGATQQTLRLADGATRPVMIVSTGKRLPAHPYAATFLHSSQFWIDDSDFDSKYALTIVQEVMALAEVLDGSRAPLITVPVN